MATNMKTTGRHGTYGKRSQHGESPSLGKSQAKKLEQDDLEGEGASWLLPGSSDITALMEWELKQEGNWSKMTKEGK